MTHPTLLSPENLWPTIRRLARRSAARAYVAVPYVGDGASRLLRLRHGDVLLCALTKANARAGSICPAELTRLSRKGVQLYQQADLHAKIYLLAGTAVITSANLSRSSRDQLDEAALVSRDASVLQQVKRWFAERLVERVTPGWLAECAKVYRPPRSANKRTRVGLKRAPPELLRRVWMMGVQPADYPEDESASYERGERRAMERLRSSRNRVIDPIRIVGADSFNRRVQEGDLVIQAWTEGKDVEPRVYPHGKILHMESTRSRRGHRVTYLYLDMPKSPRTLRWNRFKALCQTFGLRLGKHVYTRELRDRAMVHQVLSLVSPERLAR